MRRKRGMELDEIIAAMEPPPGPLRRKAHSPVYEGMWAWHDDLGLHLDYPRMPNWPDIAGKLAAKGFTTTEGKPPSGEFVRKSWWKVKRDKERQAQGLGRRSRSRRTAAVGAPGAIPAAPPPVGEGEGDDLTFAGGPKRPKG